jgi:hypothetical protein
MALADEFCLFLSECHMIRVGHMINLALFVNVKGNALITDDEFLTALVTM